MKNFFIIITSLLLINCNKPLSSIPEISSAKIDLSSYDLNKIDPVKLDGSWEFYWLRLYASEDFKKEKIPVIRYAKLPGTWNDKKTISDGTQFGDLGHATYRLNIKLKKDISYGLKLQEMNCAYNLFLNGKLILSNGTVSDNPWEMKPQFLPQYALFTPENADNEIILQISNYTYFKGGSVHSILIGSEKKIIIKRAIDVDKDLIVLGMLLIIGLYHFLVFFIRRKDISLLFFSLGCISLTIRTALQTEMVITTMYPEFNWFILILLRHVSSYLSGLWLILFLWSLFTKEISKFFISAHIIFALSYIYIILFTPPAVFSSIQSPFLIFYILSLVYLFFILFTLLIKKKQFSFIVLFGFFILAGTIINDQLFYMGVIQTGYIIPFGMIFFILSQSIILALKFNIAYDNVENLTIKLIEENKKIEMSNIDLEKKVFERTELINSQKSVLDDQILMARKIQQTIIPVKPPDLNGLKIFLKNQQLMQIGGDFVDFIVKNEKEVGLFMCDVSGHGVPGALLSSMVKMSLSHQWRENIDKPHLILKNIYDSISLNLGGNFITAIVCYINIETGKFIFSNAGHPPLIYININNEINIINVKGKAIYNFFKPDYEEISIDLKPDEKIIMYSDGVIGSSNIENDFYGEKRLMSVFQNKMNFETEKLCEYILKDIIEFSTGNKDYNDDITLLAIEYKGLS